MLTKMKIFMSMVILAVVQSPVGMLYMPTAVGLEVPLILYIVYYFIHRVTRSGVVGETVLGMKLPLPCVLLLDGCPILRPIVLLVIPVINLHSVNQVNVPWDGVLELIGTKLLQAVEFAILITTLILCFLMMDPLLLLVLGYPH